MLRTTVLPVIIFALFGVAYDVLALPTTTTTTTTMTTTILPSPASQAVESGGAVPDYSVNPCRQWWRCLDVLHNRYSTIIASFDFTRLVSVIQELCHVAMPSVRQCLQVGEPVGRQCARPTPQLRIFQDLCQEEAALRSGAACWSNGYQMAMTDCINSYQAEGPAVGACQANFNLKQCAKDRLQQIPQCSRNNIAFIVDLLHNGTRQACHNGDLPFHF